MHDRYLSPPDCRSLRIYRRLGYYPSAWNTGRIQKAMIRWADHHCEFCGASSADRLLHVHHLVWEAKHDCRYENLLVCCLNCHTRIHNSEWQPGKIWTLTQSIPDWMVARGYGSVQLGEVRLNPSDRTQALTFLLLLGVL